jgi:hypothetical protein
MDLTIIPDNNPIANIKRSTDVAGACKEIVTRTSIKIQNRKYVPVEGWMAIATAHGCNLSATDVKQVDGGISARGLVRRISDGITLGEAEGFVGDDEKTWSNRPLFARRAMAQTRAMSRAARSVFAHVVVLMDAGLETTPAEEMGHEVEIKTVVSTPQRENIPTPVQVQPKPTSAPKQLDLSETYGKFKTAISESLLQFDINRFIKASQTFEKYIDKLPEEIFEEYEHWMQKALTTLTEHIEDRNIIPTENQEADLVKLFGVWKHEIGRVCITARSLPPEETIF